MLKYELQKFSENIWNSLVDFIENGDPPSLLPNWLINTHKLTPQYSQKVTHCFKQAAGSAAVCSITRQFAQTAASSLEEVWRTLVIKKVCLMKRAGT